ncbi:MAG: Proline--tRNA ligase [Candidatus Thorarchaeota archaeon]|nr:MAG: Proline--tRNA ligase [Candidatus Thorarchaeota archaeon]
MKKSEKKSDNKQAIFDISKEENFPDWYTEICKVAELADIRYGVKGFTPFLPWSVMSMELMFDFLKDVLHKKGHLPMIFPTVIPESNLTKEAEHVDGFTPQVFWIKDYGEDGQLEEKLALRPTSETALYPMYSLWIRSWRDLPLKRYQRASIFRSEVKSTRPFLRGREFLWIESHNVFATHEEAKAQVMEDLETTKEVVTDIYGVPVMVFQRTQWDKFPGGLNTYAADTLMPDGKVIQLPSTHDLGDNFARAFDIQYLDENNETRYAFQTCYGPAISRIYGAMISVHGDDKGLRLPYAIAPYQVVIVPIFKAKNEAEVIAYAKKIESNLQKADVRVHLDDRDTTPGWKYNYWEMKGVPIRVHVGPREVKEEKIVLFRRDLMKREPVPLKSLVKEVKKLGLDIDKTLLTEAESKFEGLIVDADSIGKIIDALDHGKIARIEFCSTNMDGYDCAGQIEERTSGEIRGTRIDIEETPESVCVICGKPAKEIVYIARSY